MILTVLMWAVLAFLKWAVLALVVILALLIFLPVRVHAWVTTSPKLKYRAEVRLLGGIVPPFPVADSAWSRKPETNKRKKKRAWRKPGIRFVGGGSKASAIFDLLSGLTRVIHFEHLKLDSEFGLSDPADTGQLYGCLTPLQYGAPLPQNAFISVRPSFAQACFSATIDGSARFTVAAFLPPAARFAWRVMGRRT